MCTRIEAKRRAFQNILQVDKVMLSLQKHHERVLVLIDMLSNEHQSKIQEAFLVRMKILFEQNDSMFETLHYILSVHKTMAILNFNSVHNK